jgi:putative transcriptional regulator
MSHESFKNRFLIAMPTLNDPYYHQTVTLLFEHNDKGAMGLINKPLDITLGAILQELSIAVTKSKVDQDKVMLGGPVAAEQGFIIHTHPELCQDDIINDQYKITVSASKEVLEGVLNKQPDNVLVCLGYSAWKEGQLEQEIADNAWILSE